MIDEKPELPGEAAIESRAAEKDRGLAEQVDTWQVAVRALEPETTGLGLGSGVMAIPEALPALTFKPEPILKRVIDVTLAAAMLIASAPVWLMIALAIKLDDGGPIFYEQERWGRGGTRFSVKKFRTMIPNADQAGTVRQATHGDSRITRVGHLLRACGLDELPQLWHIFIGDMSFVGPRALATTERDRNGHPMQYDLMPGFSERLSVRPGLTGIATIYLPKDASPRRKFRTDILYVRKQSVGLDVRLIALSFWISFRGKWETRGNKV